MLWGILGILVFAGKQAGHFHSPAPQLPGSPPAIYILYPIGAPPYLTIGTIHDFPACANNLPGPTVIAEKTLHRIAPNPRSLLLCTVQAIVINQFSNESMTMGSHRRVRVWCGAWCGAWCVSPTDRQTPPRPSPPPMKWRYRLNTWRETVREEKLDGGEGGEEGRSDYLLGCSGWSRYIVSHRAITHHYYPVPHLHLRAHVLLECFGSGPCSSRRVVRLSILHTRMR